MAKRRKLWKSKKGFAANLRSIVTNQLERHGLINSAKGVSETTVQEAQVKRGQVRGVEFTKITSFRTVKQTTMTAGAQAAQRAQAFGASDTQTAYNYGQLTKNLAQKILMSGANVPAPALAAAEAAAAGRGDIPENVLLDQLRGALGIQHSGATMANRITGGIRGAVRSASNMGILISAAGQGGAIGVAAQGQILQTFFDKADSLTKNEFVQKLATKVGEKLGGDSLAGSQFLYAVSRGFQIGGAAATAAMVAWNGAEAYIGNQKRMSAAQGASYDVTREAFLATPATGRAERIRVERTAAGAASVYDQGMAMLGFGGAVAEQQARAVASNAGVALKAEKYAASLGVDVGTLLSQAAAAKGKSVSQLNAFERSTALTKAVADKMQSIRNSRAADAYARSQVIKNDEIGLLDAITGFIAPAGYDTAARRRLNSNLQRHREEFAKAQVEKAADKNREINERVERYQASLSKEQNLAIETQIRDSQASQIAYRQRHQVRWTD